MLVEVEGYRQIKPEDGSKGKLVRCGDSACGAYGVCGHAKPHPERENCYNDRPEERQLKGGSGHIICPRCMERNGRRKEL